MISILLYFTVFILLSTLLTLIRGGNIELEDSNNYCFGVEYIPKDNVIKIGIINTILIFKF